MKLSGYGEDRLVRELIARVPQTDATLLTGPGDDCAVVRLPGSKDDLLLKTDAVVEGIHFESEADPRRVGWKALSRAISDVAAMGGEPRHALITLALPGEKSVVWMRLLYAGINRAGRKHGVVIAGGETTRSPGPVFISVALTGRVERGKAILRSGGKPGDTVLVTGKLGGSIAGWHLRFQPRVAEARWLARNFHIHAMMDLSDGLGADLPRLAAASGVGFALDLARLPRRAGVEVRQALDDGEDYELLLTVAEREVEEMLRKWKRIFPRLPLTPVGRLVSEKGPEMKTAGGFQHF